MKLAGELDPLSPIYQMDVGAPFYCARQYSTCLAMARRISEAYPDWHLAHLDLGLVHLATGQLSEALAEFQRSIPPDGDPEADAMIGYVEALRGNRAAARRILDQLQRQARTSYVSPASRALIHAALDEKEKAFELLERAYQDRSMSLLLLKVDRALMTWCDAWGLPRDCERELVTAFALLEFG
jgi:tetratricopeptide (TPR) repeat protein